VAAGSLYLLYGLLCLAGVFATLAVAWVLVRVGRHREDAARARRRAAQLGRSGAADGAPAGGAGGTLASRAGRPAPPAAGRRVLTEEEAAAEARSAAGGPT
jgi:hypothetical protein